MQSKNGTAAADDCGPPTCTERAVNSKCRIPYFLCLWKREPVSSGEEAPIMANGTAVIFLGSNCALIVPLTVQHTVSDYFRHVSRNT